MIKMPLTQANLVFESIFSSQTNFWCLRPIEQIKYDLEDRFIIIINSTIKVKKLRIGGCYLEYSDNKIVDLNNIEMQMTSNPQISTTGLKLTRNKQSIELYGDLEKWIEHLKIYAVQFYFQQKYHILHKIEKGTLQNWFSIKCKLSHQEFSALIIEKSTIYNKSILLKNIQLLRNIKFPNLVKLREVYESRNQIFLVFDQIEGVYIDELRLDKTLSEHDISTIMRQLFTTLEYLHLNNIFLNEKACISNVFLRNPKDWGSVYLIDFIDVQQNYENNSTFYEYAQQDVYHFGNIMKYLLDYNNEAAQLFSYELHEWSKFAFDFYQKINNVGQQFSSYDALQHPFIVQNYIPSSSNLHSRHIFHISEIGIQQLELSTGLNSSNQSVSPVKKGRQTRKLHQVLSHGNSPRTKQEESSSNDSIDVKSILERYSKIVKSDMIVNKELQFQPSNFINRARHSKKLSSDFTNEQSLNETESSPLLIKNQQSLHQSTSIKLRQYAVKKTTIFKLQSQIKQ